MSMINDFIEDFLYRPCADPNDELLVKLERQQLTQERQDLVMIESKTQSIAYLREHGFLPPINGCLHNALDLDNDSSGIHWEIIE